MLNHQSGNAVVLVLLTIALLGALIFTFTRTGDKGQGNLSKQQASIAAQDLISYARSIEYAVSRVRSKGCSENQISFDYDTSEVTGYENANSPPDEKCHVFSSQGGGARHMPLNEQVKEPGHTEGWSYYIIQQGADGIVDLAIFAPFITETVCQEINNMLDIDGIPVDNGNCAVSAYFTGNYNLFNSIANSGTNFYDFKTTCFKTSSTASIGANTYHFFHTLYER